MSTFRSKAFLVVFCAGLAFATHFTVRAYLRMNLNTPPPVSLSTSVLVEQSTILEGDIGVATIRLTNNHEQELMITNVRTSCGCMQLERFTFAWHAIWMQGL